MPHEVPTYYFVPSDSIKAESVVPVRIRHVVPEIRVGKAGIRPVPEITAPVCGKSYIFLLIFIFYRGAIPSFAAQNSPLKGAELNAESEVPVRTRHVVPETRAGKAGMRPAPEMTAP